MSISKIAMLTFGMVILTSSPFLTEQAFAGSCFSCQLDFDNCPSGPEGNNCREMAQQCLDVLMCLVEVAGLPVPINESEVFGELAQQYSLWLIPSISAIGIAAFLIKRKL